MSGTKAMKVTKKYCRELMRKHQLFGEVAENSEHPGPEQLVKVLKEATPNSRFRVSYDPMSYGTDDEDTWDLVGPGLAYGYVYYLTRDDAEADRDALNAILREHLGPITRKAQYTSKAYVAKCVMDAQCCPACGDARVELNENRFLGAALMVVRGCNVCNAEWVETYALQGYKDLRMD